MLRKCRVGACIYGHPFHGSYMSVSPNYEVLVLVLDSVTDLRSDPPAIINFCVFPDGSSGWVFA